MSSSDILDKLKYTVNKAVRECGRELDAVIKRVLEEWGRVRSNLLIKALSEVTEFNRKTVIRHLNKLVNHGEIDKEGGEVWYMLPTQKTAIHMGTKPIRFLKKLRNPSFDVKPDVVNNFKVCYGVFFEYTSQGTQKREPKLELSKGLKEVSKYIVEYCRGRGLSEGFRLALVFTVEA
jgi:hypothetical protein